jgi:hypothetical protein
MLDALSDRPLTLDGPVTRRFRELGVRDFASAARHLLALPYGRITDRSRFWLVLAEGRGTCTTKHATLATLAREQQLDLQLMLGIYEMSERNTPGVGAVLAEHGLPHIPEAHCYLHYQGARVDITGVPAGAEPIARFLHEEPITVEQIGAYKIELHRRFLGDWIERSEIARGMSLEAVWQIREACIAALSARESPSQAGATGARRPGPPGARAGAASESSEP